MIIHLGYPEDLNKDVVIRVFNYFCSHIMYHESGFNSASINNQWFKLTNILLIIKLQHINQIIVVINSNVHNFASFSH